MKTFIYNNTRCRSVLANLDNSENILFVEGEPPAQFVLGETNCSNCILANYNCSPIPCEPTERKDGNRGVYRYINTPKSESHGNL